jgi:16S rRNA (cytidine1402-2'-O)-methyltransferase
MKNGYGTLYLIPTTMSETDFAQVLPSYNTTQLRQLTHFVVEEIKTARRFIKICQHPTAIDDLTFYELNEHTDKDSIEHMLTPLLQGIDMGVISEAGCPAIADPGADIVALAHKKNIKVVPLVGPSSILLALMASGMNGQNFCFHGYLPLKDERKKALKQLEQTSKQKKQTQLFIEAPYRNQKFLEEILQVCLPETKLCIGMNITGSDEFIVTKTIRDWKKSIPDINKKPTIFLLYCE